MKILILQDRLRSGGTERQTLWLARAFQEMGQEAAVVTFRPGGSLADKTAGVRHRVLQPFDIGLDWFAPGLVKAVAAEKPDVVLAMGRMANCHAWRLARALPSTAVIASVRTGKPLPWLYRKSLRDCRAVVANSHETAALVANLPGGPVAPVTVIHNSLVFSPRIHDTPREEARARLGIAADEVVLVGVGMFRPEKNQRSLIEAAAGLPRTRGWRLVLLGDGPEKAACEALTAKLGLTDRVTFTGFQADPRPWYEVADIAVHASYRESLSNFLAEAQAHGLPGVAWDAQGIREVINDGETGRVIASGDVAALGQAIHHLIEDNSLRQRMSATAKVHAAKLFSPEGQAQRYLELFATLTGSQKAR